MMRLLFCVLMIAVLSLCGGETVIPEKIEAMEGTLVRLSKPSGRATHRLVLIVNGKEYLLAVAGSARRDLSLWEKQPVRVEGTKMWLPGTKVPYIEIKSVIPVSQTQPWQSSAK